MWVDIKCKGQTAYLFKSQLKKQRFDVCFFNSLSVFDYVYIYIGLVKLDSSAVIMGETNK